MYKEFWAKPKPQKKRLCLDFVGGACLRHLMWHLYVYVENKSFEWVRQELDNLNIGFLSGRLDWPNNHITGDQLTSYVIQGSQINTREACHF